MIIFCTIFTLYTFRNKKLSVKESFANLTICPQIYTVSQEMLHMTTTASARGLELGEGGPVLLVKPPYWPCFSNLDPVICHLC